jgi:hypothetical protein
VPGSELSDGDGDGGGDADGDGGGDADGDGGVDAVPPHAADSKSTIAGSPARRMLRRLGPVRRLARVSVIAFLGCPAYSGGVNSGVTTVPSLDFLATLYLSSVVVFSKAVDGW